MKITVIAIRGGLCASRYGFALLAICAFVLFDHQAALSDERTITGVPRIVDGDTVEIESTKLRLVGIDASEIDQLCLDRNGQRWACGVASRDELIRQILRPRDR